VWGFCRSRGKGKSSQSKRNKEPNDLKLLRRSTLDSRGERREGAEKNLGRKRERGIGSSRYPKEIEVRQRLPIGDEGSMAKNFLVEPRKKRNEVLGG